jgi:hypothetical protein
MIVHSRFVINLKICFMLFAASLIFLSRKFPIQVPITDDWLYLKVGSHQISILDKSTFELIGGHQQVLTKITVWITGFFPGNYIQNLMLFNIFFALYGFYLLIVSQFKDNSKKKAPIFLVLAIMTVFNLKPIYLYMSATGLGLCQSVFFFGLYYYARNMQDSSKSKVLTSISIFLAPFTTGMGLALPIAHILHIVHKFVWDRKKSSSQDIYMTFIIILSFLLSYLIPIWFNNVNTRTPQTGTNSFTNIAAAFENPVYFITFIITLIGNPLVPSSRFDPILPLTIGIAIVVLLIVIIRRELQFIKVIHKLMENRNPSLTGLVFVLIVATFRSQDQFFLSDSVAPRYIFGTIFLLIGIQTFFVNNINFIGDRFNLLTLVIFFLLVSLSVTGLKTGSEWLKIRSLQSEKVYMCLQMSKIYPSQCALVASEIKEAESTTSDLNKDLFMLQNYFMKQKIF